MSAPIDDTLRLELDALLDGALSEAEAAELHARIERDAELRAEYERRRRIVELVRGLPSEVVPTEFCDSLMERLPLSAAPRTDVPPRALRGGVIRSPWLWATGLAAAAALVLVVSLGDDDPSPDDDWTLAKQDSDSLIADERRQEKRSADKSGRELEGRTEQLSPDDSAKSVKKFEQPSRAVGRLEEAKESAVRAPTPGKANDSARAESASAESGMGGVASGDARKADSGSRRERERSVNGAAVVLLLQRVEERTTVLNADERARYLDDVVRLSDADLRAHVERLSPERNATGSTAAAPKGPSAPRGAKKSKAAVAEEEDATDEASARRNAVVLLDFAVAKRAEAVTLRKLLTRAFPPRRAGFAQSAQPATKVERADVEADADRAAGGELRLDWTVSARDAKAMAIWLERLGLRNTSSSGSGTTATIVSNDNAETRATRAKAAAGKSTESKDGGDSVLPEPVPVRVRIRYGPLAREAERRKGEDR